MYKYYSIRSGGEDEMVDRGPLNQKQTSKEKKKKKTSKEKKKQNFTKQVENVELHS